MKLHKSKKAKIFITLMITFLLAITSSTFVLGDNSYYFDRSNGHSGSSSGGGSVGWFGMTGDGVKPRSGTRYAIRVQDENGNWADIGGTIYDYFWLNHTYNNYFKAKNDENDKVGAYEKVWSGNTFHKSVDEAEYTMKGYHLLQGKVAHVFTTDASSQKSYDSVDAMGNEAPRHVLSWYKNEGDVITENFGLNTEDINRLLNYEVDVANYWLDKKFGFTEMKDDYDAEIADQKALISEYEKQLEIANAEYEEYKANYDALYKEWKATGKKNYNKLKDAYDKAYNKNVKKYKTAYNKALKNYNSSITAADKAQTALDKAKTALEDAQKAYDTAVENNTNNPTNKTKKAVTSAEKTLKSKEKDVTSKEADLEKKKTDMANKEIKLNEAEVALNAAYEKIADKTAAFEPAKQQKAELEDAEAKMNDAQDNVKNYNNLLKRANNRLTQLQKGSTSTDSDAYSKFLAKIDVDAAQKLVDEKQELRDQAKAARDEAQANLDELTAERDELKKAYNKIKNDKKVSSEEKTKAKTAWNDAKKAVTAADAELTAAKKAYKKTAAPLEDAQDNLETITKNKQFWDDCISVKEYVRKVKAGRANIQIRAEILMMVRPAESCENTKKETTYTRDENGNITKTNNADVKAYVQTVKDSSGGNYYYFLTYRECLAIAGKASNLSNAINNWIAPCLFENDDPWRSEQKYLDGAKKYGKAYWNGWDYIFSGNPYVEECSVTVKYKDISTGEEIAETEHPEPGVITKKDIPGYEYVGVQENLPDEGEILYDEETFTVPDGDTRDYEITFWYEKATGVTIYYRTLTDKDIPEESEFYPEFYPLESGETDEYSETNLALHGVPPGLFEYVGTVVDSGERVEQPVVSITGDGEDHEIIFYYKQKANITVIGVCEKTEELKTFVKETGLTIPVSRTYDSYEWDGYKYLGEYTVIESLTGISYTGQQPDSEGNTATVNIEEETIVTETPKANVLVIFYYEPDLYITVTHIDEETGNILKGPNTSMLLDGRTTEFSSENFGGYINSKYVLDGVECGSGEVAQNRTIYTVPVTAYYNASGNNGHTLDFYYRKVKQKVEIHHKFEGETDDIVPPVTEDVPTEAEKLKKRYEYSGYTLNNDPKKPEDKVKVEADPDMGEGTQILIFWYKKPDVVIPTPDGGGTPDGTFPDPELQKYIADHNIGLIPIDVDNQLVGQDPEAKYWVLDHEAKLQLGFYDKDFENYDRQITGHSVSLTMPFDVYYDGDYWKANEAHSVSVNGFREEFLTTSMGTYHVVYLDKPLDLEIPIWVDEKTYTGSEGIKLDVIQHQEETYVDASGETHTRKFDVHKSASASVTVVGQIYDFSVTNLFGDDIWKTSAFAEGKTGIGEKDEHEVDTLPLGQASQQREKYLFGIKQGSRFYFSVNTKGSDNDSIIIKPKFYYIDADGDFQGEVLAYTKGKEISKIDLERTTQITDSKRTGSVYNEKVDSEFSIELKEYGRKLYGNDVYAGSKINIGTYTNIVLGKSLRTPFKGFLETSYIGKENVVGPDKKKTQNDILIEVSHWYGDYELPNDVTYKFKKDGTDVDKTGYVVIYFSIVSTRTRDSKSVSYLSYNMYSPDADPNQKAQWEVEGAKGNIALPTTNVNGSGPVVNTWFQGNKFEWDNGYMPVIVYDIDQTTAQNYDTTGTH